MAFFVYTDNVKKGVVFMDQKSLREMTQPAAEGKLVKGNTLFHDERKLLSGKV